MIREQIGHRLKDLRTGAGLTQAELAKRVGIAQTAVSKIEGGVTLPPLDTVEAWAEACGQVLRVSFDKPGDTEADWLEALRGMSRLPGGAEARSDLMAIAADYAFVARSKGSAALNQIDALLVAVRDEVSRIAFARRVVESDRFYEAEKARVHGELATVERMLRELRGSQTSQANAVLAGLEEQFVRPLRRMLDWYEDLREGDLDVPPKRGAARDLWEEVMSEEHREEWDRRK